VNGPVTAKVAHPYQVSYQGQVYKPGDAVTAPLHVVTSWTQNGWVEVSDVADQDGGAKPRK
jgi:hypothetical protein